MTPAVLKRRLEGDAAAREAALFYDLKHWPLWPWLPVKRYIADASYPQLGVIYADDIDGPVRVFAANVLSVTERHAMSLTAGFDAGLKVAETYPTVAAAIADGWMGD